MPSSSPIIHTTSAALLIDLSRHNLTAFVIVFFSLLRGYLLAFRRTITEPNPRYNLNQTLFFIFLLAANKFNLLFFEAVKATVIKITFCSQSLFSFVLVGRSKKSINLLKVLFYLLRVFSFRYHLPFYDISSQAAFVLQTNFRPKKVWSHEKQHFILLRLMT